MRRRPDATVAVTVGRDDPLALLGRALGEEPSQLELLATRTGKPVLARGPHFSMARSAGWAAVAVSDDALVGVDVEVVRPLEDIDRLVHQFVPADWRAECRPVAGSQLPFYLVWCRLEACVKACASTLDDAAACVAHTVSEAREIRPGVVAAVAARRRSRVLFTWTAPVPALE